MNQILLLTLGQIKSKSAENCRINETKMHLKAVFYVFQVRTKALDKTIHRFFNPSWGELFFLQKILSKSFEACKRCPRLKFEKAYKIVCFNDFGHFKWNYRGVGKPQMCCMSSSAARAALRPVWQNLTFPEKLFSCAHFAFFFCFYKTLEYH